MNRFKSFAIVLTIIFALFLCTFSSIDNGNEHIIKQLKLTKQRINEGSKTVREQIDSNVLPIIGSNQQAVADKVCEARHLFTSGDRLAKKAINEAIQMLVPITEIPKKYHVNQLWKKHGYPIYMSPFFAKCIAINRTEYSWEKKKAFINYIVANTEANSVRMFAYIPYPNQCHIPHPKRTGKYVLEEINEEWRAELHRVIKYCVDRGLTVRLIIADSSGTTTSGHRWDAHWLNPENNHGFRGKQTYWDQYGLLKWINYGVYDGDCTPEEKERYETNRDYFLWFFDQIIPPLHAEFKDFITLEMNEIDTADTGHGYLGRLFHRKYKFPRWRMISSPRGMDWINDKPNVNKYWIPSVHGIFDIEKYDGAIDYVIHKILPSGDGGGNNWYKGGYVELRRLVRKALENGCFGFCGNNWIPDNCDFSKLDHRSAEIFMEELERFDAKNN